MQHLHLPMEKNRLFQLLPQNWENVLNLYRATYQAPLGRPCRHMSFAAHDQQEAWRIAADWCITDRVLIVKPVRALQVPQVQLTLEA